MIAENLDEAENIIPASAVEPGGMLLQLVKNFVHLERGENGFDEHRRANRAAWDPDVFLPEQKYVIPEARFQVTLHLGQIEVGAAPLRHQGFRIVEEVKPEIEQRAGDLFAIDQAMALQQMPAA